MTRRTSFRLGEWLRALLPFLCRCAHARSAHASGRGACSRCTCPRPQRATRWSLLMAGYQLGYTAGRWSAPVTTVTVPGPAAQPTVLPTVLPDPPTVRLEHVAPAGLADDPYSVSPDMYDGWSFTWQPGGFTISGPDDEEDR